MSNQKVAIAGLGAIGSKVVEYIGTGKLPGYEVTAVSEYNAEHAQKILDQYNCKADVVALGELAKHADIIIECMPAKFFAEVADPVIEAGKIFAPLTVSALLNRPDLIERAKQTGARILAPSGALLGFDAVRTAAEGVIHSASIVTRKPPHTLTDAPYVKEKGFDLSNLKEPFQVFAGSAREGAKGFPANVNVAASLSLAGIGPDKTTLEVWADPTIERNMHTINVDADSARFSMQVESTPSLENPRTGRFTPLSVIAMLRGLNTHFKVGS